MSLLYFVSKFSNEVIILEVFLLGCLMTFYFGYVLFKKRKYGAAKNMIPDSVVKAFLFDIISNAEGFKNQLFGENFKIDSTNATFKMPNLSTSSAGETADVAAIKNQLMAALTKQDELGKAIANLNKEKSDLELKLKNSANTAPAASGGGDNKELLDKLAKLEAKLSEYEVIEDDLANLKKYQQENKQLKEQLAAAGSTAGAVAAVAAPTPEPVVTAAPTPEPALASAPTPEPVAESPIAIAEQAASQAEAANSFEGLVDKIEESLTPPQPAAGASVADTAAPPAVAAPTPSLAEVPAAADKSDADLLNEFEKMLNS